MASGSDEIEAIMAAAEALEALSRRSLELARQEDWDNVALNEAERTALAQRIQVGELALSAEDGVGEKLFERLQAIQALDQELLPLLEQARDEAGRALRQAKHSAAGARMYARVEQGE
ncbi:protein FliT [Ectothiorhodospira magna]|uniref:Flagellar protein FliT n=1 Tax=Ectothiorhodospira magna TaxID=867345 RepID=A0A1H9A333_9GAMM|nr:flagellar protein FliT [Ectothiorhodospira magna]SEP71132.1 protein FliT [Ectothiorhodospira magna]